jgi:hypothetical protein
METFQKLKILVPEKDKDFFFVRLIEEVESSRWKIRNDLVNNYKKNTFTSSKNVLCAESEKYNFNDKNIQGLLWLWDYNGFYEVFNIIPLETRHLEFNEYNFILNKFYEVFIVDLAKQFNATVTLTKPEKLLIDTIGSEAFQSLKSFSSLANKSTGNSHPYDFERWCEFVFIIFRKSIDLSSTELEAWLVENRWSDDMASKLALDFEYSISLLEKYEQH